jgi:hypothetical protein
MSRLISLIIFQRLKEPGLLLNLSKCIFGQSAVDFLEHSVFEAGTEALIKQLEAIQSFPQLQNCKDLQSFLGLVNFYERFIPAAAKIRLPLTSALQGRKVSRPDWLAKMGDAFEAAKSAVCQTAWLTHPDHSAPSSLACDATKADVSADHQQLTAEDWKPLSFYSKKQPEALLYIQQ